jgi:MFS family permease
MPLGANVLGSLAGGVVSDEIYKRSGSLRAARQGVGAVCTLICAALAASAYWMSGAVSVVSVISAGSFFAAAAGPCAYTITIDVGGRHVPAVFSTMNMCGNVGATLFPLVVPLLKQATGSWHFVLFFFSGLYVLAAAFWLLADPEAKIFEDEPIRADHG